MIEEDLCAIGFMFDAEHDRETKKISFPNGTEISLKTIGDKPGHVQSGQYLWPAAQSAGNYIIENWDSIGSDSVLELGAGCGLAGIVASKMKGVERVVWTDYDRGSLQLLEENSKENCTCKCFVHFLEWGQSIDSGVRSSNEYPEGGFRLVVGTDLIYCKEVIEPLFRTVNDVMHKEGVFVLVSSFCLNEEFEKAIEGMCGTLGLHRAVQVPLSEAKRVSKVEHFHFLSSS